MKLYLIVFGTSLPKGAAVRSYMEPSKRLKLTHYHSDGFPVSKETNNCWMLDTYPDGLPKQYRKADEYRVMNNNSGIYMFGRDPEKLINEWNSVAVA